MSSLIVVAEMRLPAESLPTFQTEVWPLLGMNALVNLQVIFPGKSVLATVALYSITCVVLRRQTLNAGNPLAENIFLLLNNICLFYLLIRKYT